LIIEFYNKQKNVNIEISYVVDKKQQLKDISLQKIKFLQEKVVSKSKEKF